MNIMENQELFDELRELLLLPSELVCCVMTYVVNFNSYKLVEDYYKDNEAEDEEDEEDTQFLQKIVYSNKNLCIIIDYKKLKVRKYWKKKKKYSDSIIKIGNHHNHEIIVYDNKIYILRDYKITVYNFKMRKLRCQTLTFDMLEPEIVMRMTNDKIYLLLCEGVGIIEQILVYNLKLKLLSTKIILDELGPQCDVYNDKLYVSCDDDKCDVAVFNIETMEPVYYFQNESTYYVSDIFIKDNILTIERKNDEDQYHTKKYTIL